MMSSRRQSWWQRLHIDIPLLLGLLALLAVSLVVLYSASGQHPEMLARQLLRTGMAFVLMIVYAGRHRRYPRRPHRYAEHLVYAAHNHAFFFLAVMLAVVVSWPALTAMLWLWALAYLLWSMKTVYGGPWLDRTQLILRHTDAK